MHNAIQPADLAALQIYTFADRAPVIGRHSLSEISIQRSFGHWNLDLIQSHYFHFFLLQLSTSGSIALSTWSKFKSKYGLPVLRMPVSL